jgi:hypothetical protein
LQFSAQCPNPSHCCGQRLKGDVASRYTDSMKHIHKYRLIAVVILCPLTMLRADTTVTFDNGFEGWVGPAGPGGSTSIAPSGGNPGAHMQTVFNNFGITFSTSINAEFLGDYTVSPEVTIGVDIKVDDISFFGTPAPRPWLVELRDLDNPPGGYPWVSVWYKFADVSSNTHGSWTDFEILIADTSASALPTGWGGYGAEGPLGEPMLPANRTFSDVLAGIDQVAFTTLEPGFFFGFTDFDVRLDNIRIASTAEPPETCFGGSAATCCDAAPLDGIRDDGCVWCTCDDVDMCHYTELEMFGDVGGLFADCQLDGKASVHDRNHILRCFGDGGACAPINMDIGGPQGACAPDGACDIHDINHTLASFAGTTLCSCPSGPVAEAPPAVLSAQTRLALEVGDNSSRSGEVDVRVVLADDVEALQSYQIRLEISGGRGGQLSVSDAQPLADSFKDADAFVASNSARGIVLAGIESDAARVQAGTVLALFTLRPSRDAAGEFVVALSADAPRATSLIGPAMASHAWSSRPVVIHVRK